MGIDFSGNFINSCKSFYDCVGDLLESEPVQKMANFTQHSDVTTLEHSVFVSYVSFIMAKKLRLNYCSAARGALLHDLFLYDWHCPEQRVGLHGFTHPAAALKNADNLFNLSAMERDIISKHMWPLTILPPKYMESLVVCMADKFCASCEVLRLNKRVWVRRILALHSLNDFKELLNDLERRRTSDIYA